jgi:hypothetical protein
MIDMSSGAFAHGQTYVALSRCRSLESLYLKKPISRKDIIIDAKVVAFMAKRETIKLEAEEVQIEEQEETVIAVEQILEPEQTKALVPANIHHDEIATPSVRQDVKIEEIQNGVVFHHDAIEGEIILEVNAGIATLAEGKFSRVTAIEVLCPDCNSPCVNPATQSQMITYELVGHTVVCSNCAKSCIVPLNAFSLQGDVIAREQPKGVTNAKREKKGRTQKERKSNKGRKTKSGKVRQPLQLSLDIRTINALNFMGVNKSELFEALLSQYEPYLEAIAAVSKEDGSDFDENHHDELEDEEEG